MASQNISDFKLFMWRIFFIGLLAMRCSKASLKVNERSNEQKIKRNILRMYDRTTRPVKNDKTPVVVNIAISLYHILDTNEKEQTFTCLLAIRQRWEDEYLVWNKSDYIGVGDIRIPASTIWIPDLVISNFAADKFNDYMMTNAIVSHSGSVLWMYPALIKTYCTLNVKYFPFDSQTCDIVFISWTYNGDELDVLYNTSFENGIYYISKNQEWAVEKISAERHAKAYACCKELYPDVTFTIHMKRGSLFYIVNLIGPCFLIFLISFLGFFLPVESGEKVNLEMTILLALVVFLLMVGESMPPTPDAIPILGMFFGSTMVMVTVALVMAVIVTNIYAKKDSRRRAPAWCLNLASKTFFVQRSDDNKSGNRSDRKLQSSKLVFPQNSGATTIQVRPSWNYIAPGTLPRLENAKVMVRPAHAEDKFLRRCHLDKNDLSSPDQNTRKFSLGNLSSGNIFSKNKHDKEFTKRHGKNSKFDMEQDMIDQEILETEWRILAKFMDRVFFWIFLALSTTTQSMLFWQMVPHK